MYLGQRFLKILPLVLVIAIIPLLVEWGGQHREAFLPKVAVDDLPAADLRIKGGNFLEMEGNKLVWQLDAATAQLFEQENYAQLEQIYARSFQDDGRVIQLEGQRGRLELDSKNLTVTGKVKVVSSDGVQLTTESLFWGDSRLSSPDWVTIERDKLRVVGKGMEADTRLSKLILKEQVTTYIN